MTTVRIDLVAPFLCVAELGSFSAAAVRLGVEKSSVSRAVGRLEDAVGARLFHRTTRRVSLTDIGQSVRDRLREPHANLDAAMRQVIDLASAPRGRVVVTAPPDFGAVLLTEAIVRLQRQHPQVEVDVRLSPRPLDIAAGGIDAAIRISLGRLADSTLRVRRIGELTAAIFAAPSYADARGVPRSLEEARLHSWIAHPSTRDIRLSGPDGAARLRVEGRVTCDEMGFVHGAVLQGAGLGVLPHFLADADVRAGRLVPVLPRFTLPSAHIWFVTPARPHQPPRLVETLRDFVIEVLVARSMAARP